MKYQRPKDQPFLLYQHFLSLVFLSLSDILLYIKIMITIINNLILFGGWKVGLQKTSASLYSTFSSLFWNLYVQLDMILLVLFMAYVWDSPKWYLWHPIFLFLSLRLVFDFSPSVFSAILSRESTGKWDGGWSGWSSMGLILLTQPSRSLVEWENSVLEDKYNKWTNA